MTAAVRRAIGWTTAITTGAGIWAALLIGAIR